MLAFIPARAGSKGIPGKNLAMLAGKPLIAHTIEAALAAKSITRVVVSTDSPDIRDVAVKFGAEVPYLRSSALASDSARAFDVLREALPRLGSPEELCYLQPTSPLRLAEDIEAAIALLRERAGAESVISLVAAPCPRRWYKRLDERGVVSAVEEGARDNRQEEDPMYIPNGAIYVLRTRSALQAESFTPAPNFGYVMPRERSVDIDWPLDLRFAEFLLSDAKVSHL